MPFLDNLHFVALQCQLEQRDDIAGHELRGDRTATQARKLLRRITNVLGRLHDADLILATLRLYGNDIMAAVLVEAAWPYPLEKSSVEPSPRQTLYFKVHYKNVYQFC